MTIYESDLKTISSGEEVVFAILSDLTNLKKFQDNAPQTDKVKDIQFDSDSCSFVVEGFGKMGFRIIERTPYHSIKLDSENAPVHIRVNIQLKQVAENSTEMKLVLNAELPMMIKMMVDKKLKEGVNMVADVLAKALSKTPNL